MSRPAAAMNAGQTNRRFVMFAVVLGLIGAILVYVAFSRAGDSGGGGTGDQIPVVVAKVDIAARSKITGSMIEVRLMKADDASTLAYSDTADLVDKVVTRYPIAANEQVLSSKVIPAAGTSAAAGKGLSFVVPQGKRAIAITVEEVVAAGGLILPGDFVDILVVYDIEFAANPADPTQREKAEAYFIHTLFQGVEVLAVSQTLVDSVLAADGTTGESGSRARNSEAKVNAEAATITLALRPEEAQKLYLADSNGRIRLTVRPYSEPTEVRPIDSMVKTDLFPRNLPNPFIR